MIKLRKKKTEETSKSSVEVVIKKQNEARARFLILHAKPKIFILSMIMAFILTLFLFFRSNASLIKSISLSGNLFYTQEEIMEMLGLSYKSRYWMVFEKYSEHTLLKDPLIKECTVKKNTNGNIEIVIQEKKIVGYLYGEGPQILFEDGTIVALDDQKAELIVHLPYISGFSEEALGKIAKELGALDDKLLDKIAEIHHRDEPYDETAMKLVTIDGLSIYTSSFGLASLEGYNGILSSLKPNIHCLYVDDMTGNVWGDDCSFVNPPIEEEDPDEETENTEDNSSLE